MAASSSSGANVLTLTNVSTSNSNAKNASLTQYLQTISHSQIAPPLDYSFQEIKSMSELADHEPNPPPKKDEMEEKEGRGDGFYQKKRDRNTLMNAGNMTIQQRKSRVLQRGDVARQKVEAVVTGIRLSYNELTSLKGFAEAIEMVIPNAKKNLTWLDLSHNKLTSIDEVLLEFPYITSLYLHGNAIAGLYDVAKLNHLHHLSKLTLHGNPIYEERYNFGLTRPRSAIVWTLRDTMLKSLDFITLTELDRNTAKRWGEVHKKKKLPGSPVKEKKEKKEES